MKLINKLFIGTLGTSAVVAPLGAYLFNSSDPKIIRIAKSEKDRNKISKNPMQSKRRQHNYSVCIIRQGEKIKDFENLNKFCRNKWFFNK